MWPRDTKLGSSYRGFYVITEFVIVITVMLQGPKNYFLITGDFVISVFTVFHYS